MPDIRSNHLTITGNSGTRHATSAHRFPARAIQWPLLAGLLLALCSASLEARPAPWYKWRSKIDGHLVCAQTTLGFGWEQDSGPYKDSRCEKLVLVK